MAITTRPPPTSQPRQTNLVRLIATVLIALITLIGLVVLIIWLAVRPKKLVYTLENASINGLNINKHQLNATFNLELRAHNPNTRMSVYYDKIDVYVTYDDVTLATKALSPFYQRRKNVTYIATNVVARDYQMFNAAERDLKRDRSSGQVELAVKLRARIRYKVGIWKSDHKKLKVYCSPVLVNLSGHNKFESIKCDVDT